jgi:hypothetical protein
LGILLLNLYLMDKIRKAVASTMDSLLRLRILASVVVQASRDSRCKRHSSIKTPYLWIIPHHQIIHTSIEPTTIALLPMNIILLRNNRHSLISSKIILEKELATHFLHKSKKKLVVTWRIYEQITFISKVVRIWLRRSLKSDSRAIALATIITISIRMQETTIKEQQH